MRRITDLKEWTFRQESGSWCCTVPGPLPQQEHRTFLDFDGVIRGTVVRLNGEQISGGAGGSFRINISDKLTEQKNEIELELPENSAGRSFPRIRLTECDPIHFAWQGIHLKYLPAANRLLLEGTVENHSGAAIPGKVTLVSELFDPLSWEMALPRDSWHFARTVSLKPCEQWSPGHPALYDIHFQLDAGIYSDKEKLRYGIRSIQFDSNGNVLLNGTVVKLNRIRMSGIAGGETARDQLERFRKAGFNAVCTGSFPDVPELLALCDELGFPVADEAADLSERGLCSMVMRDRSHPCVIQWNLGVASSNREDAGRLVSLVQMIDTERPAAFGEPFQIS